MQYILLNLRNISLVIYFPTLWACWFHLHYFMPYWTYQRSTNSRSLHIIRDFTLQNWNIKNWEHLTLNEVYISRKGANSPSFPICLHLKHNYILESQEVYCGCVKQKCLQKIILFNGKPLDFHYAYVFRVVNCEKSLKRLNPHLVVTPAED